MPTPPRPALDDAAIAKLRTDVVRALARADAEEITGAAVKIAGNAYALPSGSEADRTYFVVFKDRGIIPNIDVCCNCKAGLRGLVCKHAAVAAVAHKRVAADGTILARIN